MAAVAAEEMAAPLFASTENTARCAPTQGACQVVFEAFAPCTASFQSFTGGDRRLARPSSWAYAQLRRKHQRGLGAASVVHMGGGEQMSLSQHLTAEQVAKGLGLTQNYIYRLARAGEIPYVRIGRTVRFSEAELEKWLADRTVNKVREEFVPLSRPMG